MSRSGQAPEPALRKAVLCAPFYRSDRPAGEAKRLEGEIEWVTRAAAMAGFDLRPVRDSYDSSEQIVDRICNTIRGCDLVVVLLAESSPNVFFEAGYALGLAKPIFYVARSEKDVPFNLSQMEWFAAGDFIDETTVSKAADGMRNCFSAAGLSLGRDPAFGAMHAKLLGLNPSNLLGGCMQHAFGQLADWVESWTDTSFEIVGATPILEMGCHIMRQLENTGFATSYYSGQWSWQTESYTPAHDYFNATRAAVKDGATVTRVYVIDDLAQLDEQDFRERARADSAAGIIIKYILASKLPDSRARDFGLWDETLFCEVEYSTHEATESPELERCHYWSDNHRLKRAKRWRDAIERDARPCPDLPSERLLLRESALLINDREGCKKKNLSDQDCSVYHVAWQPLRLGNLVSTPGWHGDFYADAIGRWSDEMAKSEGPIKVLITGLADYGMLYWTLQSMDAEVRERCQFNVLDICETPLDSARWLQQRLMECEPPLRIDLLCRHENVFANKCSPGTMDLIVSDAFLSRFTPLTAKEELLEEWLRLRSPRGWIVTTARVRHGSEDIHEVHRQRFMSRARMFGLEMEGELKVFLDDFAPEYARYIKSHPFATDPEVHEFLGRHVPAEIPWTSDVKSIEDLEMVKANYAYIVIGSDSWTRDHPSGLQRDAGSEFALT